MQAVEERVTSLESVLRDFIIHTDVSLSRLEREVEELKDEMKDFKSEMKDFKDEMLVFKDGVDVFKDEMSKFRTDMEADHKEMNKQWAGLANKMGTLDEDLIAPAVRPVLNKYFKCGLLSRSIRNLKRKNGDNFEVDVLAASRDKVFMIEVKSSPKSYHVEQVIEKADLFYDFFPEYKDKELITIFASIIFPEDVIKHATNKHLYLMAYREWEYMDIINFDDLNKNI